MFFPLTDKNMHVPVKLSDLSTT